MDVKRVRTMIVNLIKSKQMFSLTLPEKIKGQYWLSDFDDNGVHRDLLSIEAIDGVWTVKSNKLVSVLNAQNQRVEYAQLLPMSFLSLRYQNSDERIILYAEAIEPSRQTFSKIVMLKPATLTIGRASDNNLYFASNFTSGHHAQLSYDGSNWAIYDQNSTNGTYVNGYRVEATNLCPGDMIYIMGLRIVVGNNYFAVNNPDGALCLQANDLINYTPQTVENIERDGEEPELDHFYRSPRFYREIEHSVIKIDPPPQVQKLETVPLALMLGPSLTMAMTSLSTGLLSVSNVLNNGGDITQALPTLLMSVSMLMGTVLWPVLTKRYEKKQRIKNEQKRQKKYLEYLDEVRDEIKRKCKEQSDILRENLVDPNECISRVYEQKANLWERTSSHSDFLRLRLGLGVLPLDADVDFPEKKFTMDEDNLQDAMLSLGSEPKILSGVPISISLTEKFISGMYGEKNQVTNLIKTMILQTIALHSYDEVKIMLIADNEDGRWDFVRFVPHFWDNDKKTRFFATTPDEVKELCAYIESSVIERASGDRQDNTELSPYYVIIAADKKLAETGDAIEQLLRFKENVAFSLIYGTEALNDLPKEVSSVVYVGGNDSCIFDRTDTTGKTVSFTPDTVNESVIDSVSEKIANIELDLASQRYALPSMITFMEMFNVGKIEHLNSLTRWKENNPTKTLRTPVGVDSLGGIFNLDLHEKFHGPHGLVAGMTGSGKSEFIITYILSLAVNYHPDEVAFILIDYKGGGLTGAFEDEERGIKLPHLAGTITNLDGAAVKRSLISIQSELRRRQAIFNEARKVSNEGTMDIYKYQQLYRDKVVSEPVPHLFIISDEFAELKTQQPEFMEQLISAARIGRSLGVHLILATQKPSGVVDDQIWSNSKFRVCLKVQEKADSQDMIKCPDAAELSQTGRFYLQVGFNELFALGQSAWCGAEYIPTETVEKSVDNSIQIVDNLGRVLMNAKPAKKVQSSKKKVKQIVSIVKYLSDLASEESISVRPLWLPPISPSIYVDALEEKYGNTSDGTVLCPVVGEYDDPFNQKQGVLTIPFSEEGNCLIYGSTGNGKTTMLTTIAYSLIKHHTARELNLYIMDFGSETLKVFERAPQVGGVIVSSDTEKAINFFKMLHRELEYRKNLFSEYGGDYASYCKNSGNIVTNIVVLINNYAGFAEQYEDLIESFALLSRDGVKYGIYFVVTASNTNAIRYVIAQNFRMTLCMQLNDATDYSIVIGKTDGLVPSKFKGRGLVALDRAYEFQTAFCSDAEDTFEYLSGYCAELRASSEVFAKKIPVLPQIVKLEDVVDSMTDLKSTPVGIGKKSLNTVTCNLAGKVAYPVVSQEIHQSVAFLEEWLRVLGGLGRVECIDAEQVLDTAAIDGISYIDGEYEEYVREIFADTVERNNTYKDARMDVRALDRFEERTIVVVGFKRLYDQLSADGQEKLSLVLLKAEAIYKLHFVIVDAVSDYSAYSYSEWYKKQISGSDGIWIGDGIADQYMLKINKVTSELYEEIGDNWGYVLTRNRPTLVKLLSSEQEEAE